MVNGNSELANPAACAIHLVTRVASTKYAASKVQLSTGPADCHFNMYS